MALNFPANPQIGNVYNYKGVSYRFNGYGWAPVSTPGVPNDAPVFVSDCPPNGAHQGDLWFQAGTGTLWLYYCDPSGCQWITTMPLPDGVLTEAGGTVEGPLFLTAPIDSNANQQAINVGFVSDMIKAGNGVEIDFTTKTVQRIDCGSFIPA
jgi:hypothetical protein